MICEKLTFFLTNNDIDTIPLLATNVYGTIIPIYIYLCVWAMFLVTPCQSKFRKNETHKLYTHS